MVTIPIILATALSAVLKWILRVIQVLTTNKCPITGNNWTLTQGINILRIIKTLNTNPTTQIITVISFLIKPPKIIRAILKQAIILSISTTTVTIKSKKISLLTEITTSIVAIPKVISSTPHYHLQTVIHQQNQIHFPRALNTILIKLVNHTK